MSHDSSSSSSNKNYFLTKYMFFFVLTVLVIAILVGTVFVIQHLYANHLQEQIIQQLNISLSNQDNIIKNQKLIHELTSTIQKHEEREENIMRYGNGVSANNSEKLDRLLKHFTSTKINKDISKLNSTKEDGSN